MTFTAQNSNNVTYRLPPQIIYLGEALPPVIKTVRQAMARKVYSSGLRFEVFADLSSHLDVIANALTHFAPRIEGLMTDVILNEDSNPADVNRAAGRLEQVLSEFVDGYQRAKAAYAVDINSKKARLLLLGVYRHHVGIICDWLDDLVKAINDPLAVLEKQSIPVTSNVVLTVSLNMTSPLEMLKLDALAKKLRQEAEAYIEATAPRKTSKCTSSGILETMGVLAFGAGFIKVLFGRHQ